MLNQLTETAEKLTVLQGQVTAFNQEGSIAITGRDGNNVNCFIATLHKSEIPEISVSDTVIYTMDGNKEYGFILGVVCRYIPTTSKEVTVKPPEKLTDAIVDGQRIFFEAQKEIILKCGTGSIIMKKDGKIVIKGTNIITRARNTNKIKGATVTIN